MSQEINVEKLDDLDEAKKASFGVNAEVPDPTDTKATPPGKAPAAGDKTPPSQGSSVKPYTKVGMINAMVQSLGSMKKVDVSAAYDKMMKEGADELDGDAALVETSGKIEKLTKEDIDVSDDIKAIFEGTDLSEEFVSKAKDIYEAAVLSKINEHIQLVNYQYEAALSEETSTLGESLVERLDSYLDYVVEQWMEQNAVAIETGLKAEIAEGFMKGLHSLFAENFITVPDEAVDMVEEMSTKVEVLESTLNEEIERNIELSEKLKEFERTVAFAEVAEGLAESQIDKLESLAETIEFEDVESYKNKITHLRESYFPSKPSAVAIRESVTLDEEPVDVDDVEKQVPGEMAAYMNAISRSIKK